MGRLINQWWESQPGRQPGKKMRCCSSSGCRHLASLGGRLLIYSLSLKPLFINIWLSWWDTYDNVLIYFIACRCCLMETWYFHHSELKIIAKRFMLKFIVVLLLHLLDRFIAEMLMFAPVRFFFLKYCFLFWFSRELLSL